MIPHDSAQTASETDPDTLRDDMLAVLARSNVASLSAPEIAQAIRPDGDWHALLGPIRRVAARLAAEGQLIIYRKGKPVDPTKFSGVFRIGLPRQD